MSYHDNQTIICLYTCENWAFSWRVKKPFLSKKSSPLSPNQKSDGKKKTNRPSTSRYSSKLGSNIWEEISFIHEMKIGMCYTCHQFAIELPWQEAIWPQEIGLSSSVSQAHTWQVVDGFVLLEDRCCLYLLCWVLWVKRVALVSQLKM